MGKVKAFSIHLGELSEARLKCLSHNAKLTNLTLIGNQFNNEVSSQGIRVADATQYSEVLRLILLSREPNLLYLDTDCWLVEPPDFKGPGRSRKSNWAMYSGNTPELFAIMLSDMRDRGRVAESLDWATLVRANAQVINAIHKWEIPWFKEP